jgi:PDZ domain-containing protein
MPGRLLGGGLLLAAVVVGIGWFAPSDSYLIVPDEASPLAPLVQVEGEREPNDDGGILYVDVIVRKASLAEEQISALRPDGADAVPAHAIVPPGTNIEDRREQNLRAMDRSQEIAAAVALRELGHDVGSDPQGAQVVAVARDAPAAGKLEAADVIVAVDGSTVATPADLRRLIGRHDVGETVRLLVRAGETTRTVEVGTIASPEDAEHPIVGIQVEQFAEIEVPIEVEIDLGNVGGPSAGLAFALDVVEELRGDVDRGNLVAATGELQLDGTVSPVGGLKQKTIGARRAGADVFLVPAGDNAAEARRHADGLRIIAVESFQQALQELATVPRKG